jgi:uncharacterized protein YecT (DUF1311 family)
MNLKLIIPVLVVGAVVVIAGVLLLRQDAQSEASSSPTAPPASSPTLPSNGEQISENEVLRIIENLPDNKLLSSLAPIQERGKSLELRVIDKPQEDNPYFIVEAWESLSGATTLFQRYRYNVNENELSIDLSLNPDEFDIYTRSVLNIDTGEVIAVIDKDIKEGCSGPQIILNFCAGREEVLADGILNTIYQRILADTTISQGTKNTLLKEQNQWSDQRIEECAPEFDNSEQYDGSIQPLVAAKCRENMTRERINELLSSYF